MLSRPPITEARGGKAAAAVVGSGFRGAAAAYDESLRYLAEIDESDRTFCYVSKAVKVDAQCLQRLYTSDRTQRSTVKTWPAWLCLVATPCTVTRRRAVRLPP